MSSTELHVGSDAPRDEQPDQLASALDPDIPVGPRGRRTPGRILFWAVLAVALVAFAVWAKGRIDGLSTETQAANPIVRWEWLFLRERTPEELWQRLVEHLKLTVIPVGLGFALSALLSTLAIRFRWTFTPITAFAGFLYTIPSVALFGVLGTRYSYLTAAIVALTSYTLLILVRNIVAGIDSVPRAVIDAADGMGMSRSRRLLTVELPLALPVIVAGLRIATVTTIGLVAITGIIQLGGFGQLILDGYNDEFYTKLAVGSVLSIVLAVTLDVLINRVEVLLTPWSRKRAPQ